jgi:hypothetical protein
LLSWDPKKTILIKFIFKRAKNGQLHLKKKCSPSLNCK